MGNITRKKDTECGGTFPGGSLLPSQMTETIAARGTAPEGPTLTDILQVIIASREVLEIKIDTLAMDMGILRDHHRRLTERVTTVEGEIAEVPPPLVTMKERLYEVVARVNILETRAEDVENRSRRNNITVIGVPE